MAIKPRSRAHEDRIKALEGQIEWQKNLVSYVLTEAGWRQISDDVWEYPKKQAQMPWYKRIFGL